VELLHSDDVLLADTTQEDDALREAWVRRYPDGLPPAETVSRIAQSSPPVFLMQPSHPQDTQILHAPWQWTTCSRELRIPVGPRMASYLAKCLANKILDENDSTANDFDVMMHQQLLQADADWSIL
jgi:hypothetical protein